MRLELTDSRRLTGPNLHSAQPGALCEVRIEGVEVVAVIEAWRAAVRQLIDGLGWRESQIIHRVHAGGVCLVITAPIDALYAATEVNEAAWQDCCRQLRGQPPAPRSGVVATLARAIAVEANPRLLKLRAAAASRGQRFLSDDDTVSLGCGAGSICWPVDALPDPRDIDWDSLSHIPVALITGTNGKSTSVRLAARIVEAAGRRAGLTSTDFIQIGDEVVERGDYSGPGGARRLLRDPRVEVALLEVARGGMLRRGLGVAEADAALITNVAADHLGEYGIDTVNDLVAAKFVVRRALADDRPLVLNADDGGLVAYARSFPQQRLLWFSEDLENLVVEAHRAAGGVAASLRDEHIVLLTGDRETAIAAIEEIPITLGGAARHNVQNALGVTALCHALGIAEGAIAAGLREFRGSPEDNPGRGNLFERNGIRILVDFAHNEHALRAVAETVARQQSGRRLVMLGQAGDRSDAAIADLLAAALRAEPDRLLISDLPGQERGRASGEVAALIRDFALSAGYPERRMVHVSSPAAGAREALEWAQPGDFLLLLALTERQEIIEMVQNFGGQ